MADLVSALGYLGIGSLVGSLFSQWVAHRRERKWKHEEALREAYAEWLGRFNYQFDLLAAAASFGSNREEVERHAANLATSTYRILLLDPDPSFSKTVKSLADSLPDLRDPGGASNFRAEIEGRWGSVHNPFRTKLEELIGQLAKRTWGPPRFTWPWRRRKRQLVAGPRGSEGTTPKLNP
jgi:hypothetical protein